MRKRLAIAAVIVIASLNLPALASSDASVDRPMSGSCDIVPVIEVSPGRPGFYPYTLTGTCRLAHLGFAKIEASGLIHPPVFFGEGSYTAPNGDTLAFSFSGQVLSPSPPGFSFALSGSQTFIGGTGRFAGASGRAQLELTAITQGAGIPGVGSLTIDGSITY